MKPFLEKYHAAAAVSVVLLFVIVMMSALLFTWGIIEAKHSELEARQTQLEALKRRAAQPLAKATAELQNVKPFFGDGPFALAANELQQRIVGMIESAGGALVSVGIDPPVTADDDTGRKVVVQAAAELSNDGLQEVLYRLESEPPFVFVENLTVTNVAPRDTSDAEGAAAPKLSVDLRAAGYFRKAAP